MVPVVAGSLAHLWRLRRPRGLPPWTPTFSTAVYALGAEQAGRLTGLEAVSRLSTAAGLATVVLWLITAGLHLAAIGRRIHEG
jgi:tellurite resistance protein TehA-like permease